MNDKKRKTDKTKFKKFTARIKKLVQKHPADIADELEDLPEEAALKILRQLPREIEVDSLEEMEPTNSAELLGDLGIKEAALILERMAPDNAADLLEELTDQKQKALLEEMSIKASQVLSTLLAYPEDTAGTIMSPEVISLSKDMTAEEAIGELRRKAEKAETIYYVYVTDQDKRLLGVLSLRNLTLAPPNRKLEDILNPEVHTLQAGMDKEEVARLFDKYDYLTLPVVDDQNHLLGVVTVDDIIDVIQDEVTEDIHGMVGVSGEERVFSPWTFSFKKRLPWLYINLATAIAASLVVGAFESTIDKLTALAVFMPVVAGMGGNAGAQALAVTVRGLALGEIDPQEGKKALMKEVAVGSLNGIAIGVVVGILAYLWQGRFFLGIVAGIAMLLTLIMAGIAGVAIPLGLKALGQDPALASTIFLTTVTDIMGFFFFLGLAAVFINYLV